MYFILRVHTTIAAEKKVKMHSITINGSEKSWNLCDLFLGRFGMRVAFSFLSCSSSNHWTHISPLLCTLLKSRTRFAKYIIQMVCMCECVNEKKGTEKKNKVDERWWRTSFAALFTRQSICVKMIFFELKSHHNIGQMICWSSVFFGAFNRMSTHPRPHFNGFFSLMNWSLLVHREYNWCYSLEGEWVSECENGIDSASWWRWRWWWNRNQ